MAPSRIPPKRRNTWVAVPVLIAAASTPFATRGGMELTLERIGHWGGCSNDVQIVGDRAYLAIGPRVVVLDVSSPDEPTFLGHSEPLPTVVGDIFVDGPLLYAVTFYDGLHVLDVSEPDNITVRGSHTSGVECRGVVVLNGYAYAGDFDSALHTYDVCDPAHPELLDSTDTSWYVFDVTEVDGYLYVPTWAGLDIFDLSDPRTPHFVRNIERRYSEVTYDGTWLYAIDLHRLDVWDVSNPGQPMFMGTCPLEGYSGCTRVTASGGYVYAASASSVHPIDVHDPAEPIHHDPVRVDGWVHAMVATAGTLHIANWYFGFATFDISAPESPVEIGRYDRAAHVHALDISNGHAYLTGYRRRDIQVIDVSTPARPQREHSLDISAWRVHTVGDRAYIARASEPGGLVLADVGDSGVLDVLSELPLPNSAFDVAVHGDFAYVAVYDTGVAVVDVSVPESPVLRGVCPVDRADRVDVAYPYVYVAGGFSHMWHVVDVSDPENPFVVESIECPTGAFSVLVAGDLLFVSRRRGVEIFSLSTPDTPTWLGDFSLEYGPNVVDLAFANNRLYMLPRLAVIDVSDPTEPRLVGEHFRGTAYASGIELDGKYVYAANNSSGLSVFEIHLIADLDDDGDVDGSDLADFLDRYGTCVGHPDYSESADFDGDGCINLSDLAELLSHYGNQL